MFKAYEFLNFARLTPANRVATLNMIFNDFLKAKYLSTGKLQIPQGVTMRPK